MSLNSYIDKVVIGLAGSQGYHPISYVELTPQRAVHVHSKLPESSYRTSSGKTNRKSGSRRGSKYDSGHFSPSLKVIQVMFHRGPSREEFLGLYHFFLEFLNTQTMPNGFLIKRDTLYDSNGIYPISIAPYGERLSAFTIAGHMFSGTELKEILLERYPGLEPATLEHEVDVRVSKHPNSRTVSVTAEASYPASSFPLHRDVASPLSPQELLGTPESTTPETVMENYFIALARHIKYESERMRHSNGT